MFCSVVNVIYHCLIAILYFMLLQYIAEMIPFCFRPVTCRYRVFLRAEEVRKVMILNHLGFLQCPSRDRCFHGDACVDKQLVALLDTVPQE